MAKREVFGVCSCPECGFEDAEIKAQKNGFLYRWCPECNAQYFTRDSVTSERLRAKIRGVRAPVAVSGTVEKPKPAPVPDKVEAPAPVVVPKPPKQSGLAEALSILGGGK